MNQFSSQSMEQPRRLDGKQRLANLLVSALPWMIIAGLLYAGLFIKPQAVGASVTPPALERRDRVYGIAHGEGGTLLAAASNGKILAVGADRKIARQTTPANLSLQDIAAYDAKHAVAVGNDNVILTTDDGGKHWIKADKVPRSQVANKLNRVRTGTNGIAVAVGEMGALLRTQDYGKTWERLREEEDVAWNDVAILDGSAFVVVGEFGKILRSVDGGKTWEKEQAPVEGSLMAVAFRDASNGIAVGLDGVVLSSSDGGRQWTRIKLPAHEHLLDVLWNADKKEWFAVGLLGRWIAGTQGDTQATDSVQWKTGVLGERALSWHTRALASGSTYWLAGADVGTWDGQRWTPFNPN
ncbi:MAG TPA: YCF48-related protein [Noviherbaspirillum sp.]|uniref:WD40/YVTN/BNR-like repeat-containing protein n=1 Tax=Noviherbaspirillum sp. TaxID=1926288 RepID=UPI002B469C2B|nr:YCF48-related protein [Noviherbaspirillum sp.]HJV86875.1 YCF48-related protein [Noviherbaspirillum sp.]